MNTGDFLRRTNTHREDEKVVYTISYKREAERRNTTVLSVDWVNNYGQSKVLDTRIENCQSLALIEVDNCITLFEVVCLFADGSQAISHIQIKGMSKYGNYSYYYDYGGFH